jgi:nucleoside-diphosphate-sugar epimerase
MMDAPSPFCIAITGATGFLGRRVLSLVLKRGLRCRALVRAGAALEQHSEAVTAVRGDLRHPATLETLVRGADAVIHAAAAMGTSDEALLREVNERGSRLLAEAAAQAGVARFVYVSSMAARRPEDGPYAASKAAGEQALAGFPGTCAILQPPLIYGPGGQATQAIARLSRLGVVPVIGSSAALYPVHVDDVAAACVAAATRADLVGGVFTLPGPEGIAFPEFTRAVLRALGSKARLAPLPGALSRVLAGAMEKAMGQPLLTREGVRAVRRGSATADFSAAAEALGFAPRDLEAGLATLR